MGRTEHIHNSRLRLAVGEVCESDKLVPKGRQLIVVMGLQGCGKSTCARLLARRLHGVHFDSDQIRQDLFSEAGDEDRYSEPAKLKIDEVMYSRGIEFACKSTAILDATFGSSKRRRELRDAIERSHKDGATFRSIFLFVDADDDVARARMLVRQTQPENMSRNSWEHRESSAKRYEPLDVPYIHIENHFVGAQAIERLEQLLDLLVMA